MMDSFSFAKPRNNNNNNSDNNNQEQNLSLSLDEISNSLFDIARGLELSERNDNQFFSILGENEHLFSAEEIEKWFCGKDEGGRIYFYEDQQGPSSSSWKKMETSNNNNEKLAKKEETDEMYFSDENEQKFTDHYHHHHQQKQYNRLSNHERSIKAHSVAMISPPNNNDSFQDIKFYGEFKHSRPFQDYKVFVPPPPNKLESSDIVLHDSLGQTRIQISGKLKRKHWTNSYVVLTQYYLYFFKDQKNMFSPQKSDFIIGLLNAKVEWCSNESSRKNCFKVITFDGKTLLHNDDREKSIRWVEQIDYCIAKLTPIQNISNMDGENEFEFRRSCSTKCKDFGIHGANTIAGYTKFSHSSPPLINEKRKKIRERLLNFLKKRPPVESLREKGIIKDENVFGCTLELICQRENSKIPRFVHECVQAIEKKDIIADGIYRACGNLSTVQKLRFEINQEKYQGLWKESDVHVLTGLLKMFFREMKEPLFPYDRFESLIKLIAIEDRETKLESLKSLIQNLPEPNFHTLKFILQHLLRVTKYSKQNRMHIQNLAIVFGPTLIRKMNDLNNLVFDMMLQVQQSQVIEFLLQEYYAIFEF